MAFDDLCRLCGTDTLNVLRNCIFEGEGRAKKYAIKISECLPLQVGSPFSQPRLKIDSLLALAHAWPPETVGVGTLGCACHTFWQRGTRGGGGFFFFLIGWPNNKMHCKIIKYVL
jgi:hypothetical protein